MVRIAERKLCNTPVLDVVSACAKGIPWRTTWHHYPGTILTTVIAAIEVALWVIWQYQCKSISSVLIQAS